MALPPEVLPLVRNFNNNSFRYLFKHGDNVSDLVGWQKPKIAPSIDFTQLVVEPDSFITPGFAELESDVLLRAPFQTGTATACEIQVYLLVEHQSEPEEHTEFRACRYVMQVYDKQEELWLQTHANTRELRFHPVMPIVFYSGTRTWTEITKMRHLVHHGALFGAMIPSLEPVFINLHETPTKSLQTKVGTFGWVLWLIQQKRSREAEFRDVLGQVVAKIDSLHEHNPARWRHLLWFTHALVYHARVGEERQHAADFIRSAVRQTTQPEVAAMGKTIFDVVKEEGALEAKREMLLRQLRLKFKSVPEAIEAEIQTTLDSRQLDLWIDAFATARSIRKIPCAAKK
jgi:hypothetical protein